MKEVSKWLQSNPTLVMLMFLVSLTSGVIGIALGWEQFYEDYLSKSVEIPIWLLLLAALLTPLLVGFYRSVNFGTTGKELIPVEGKQFGVERLVLDGKSFERCEFHGTEVIFEGANGFSLVRCNFHAPRIVFAKYAATTIGVLTTMYQDQAFRSLIDRTIENIRAGKHPEAILPSGLN